MFEETISFEHLTTFQCLALCFLNSFIYVLSLYIWKYNNYNNQSEIIKRKFLSVSLASVLSILLIFNVSKQHGNHTLWQWIGFEINLILIIKSAFISLFLTVILFLGPVVQSFVVWHRFNYNLFRNFNYLPKNIFNVVILRNYVFSPITEEIVFRSCMIPLLFYRFKMQAIFIAPAFFGLAHLHHIFEGYFLLNESFNKLLIQHLFQFCYTYIFGIYSSYLFILNGSLAGSILTHSFCNFMG
jgi:prenyl protein peptidase